MRLGGRDARNRYRPKLLILEEFELFGCGVSKVMSLPARQHDLGGVLGQRPTLHLDRLVALRVFFSHAVFV